MPAPQAHQPAQASAPAAPASEGQLKRDALQHAAQLERMRDRLCEKRRNPGGRAAQALLYGALALRYVANGISDATPATHTPTTQGPTQ